MPAISTQTREALSSAQIDGTRLVLPNWLDRKDYKAVDQVLRNLGGAWKRQEKAHVFSSDPSEAVRQVVSRDDRKHREVRELIARYGGGWMDLEDGAFAESGTNVRAVVFWIDKPDDWEPEQDRPAKQRGKPTEEQKAERRAEDQELKAAVDEALEDDAFAQQLAGRVNRTPIDCRLRHYSPRNQALVFAQADALGVRVTGHLNTFKGWAEQGRMVVRGSSALRIVAAMGDEEEQADDQQEQQEEGKQPRRRFRFTARFDFSQTKGADEE